MQTWRRRTAGLIVAAVGAAVVAVVIFDHLFAVGPAFERMSDGFRPVMKPGPVARLQSDLESLNAVSDEFGLKAVPMLSGALGMSPEQFTSFMSQQYPAVATGVKQLPGIVTRFQGVVGTLHAEEGRFAQADAIPTSSLPATTVPWGLLVSGIVLLALGLIVLTRPGRLWPGLAGALGLLLVVAPLALSLPHKASDADAMNKHLQPVYTAQMLAGAKGALTTVGAMGEQMRGQMLPALGQRLGMDQVQLQSFLQQNLPAMAAGMEMLPQAMGRFEHLVTTFDAHLGDYNTLQPVAFAPVVWAMIAGGILALAGGAWGLLIARKREIEEVRPIELKAA